MRRYPPIYRTTAKQYQFHMNELATILDDGPLSAFADDCMRTYAMTTAVGEALALKEGLGRCESPIEKRLAIAMTYMDAPLFFSESEARPRVMPVAFTEDTFRVRHPEEGIEIYPQHQLGDHRVDFFIVCRFEGRADLRFLVVECDGHDFHERTKEQARRDRRRDRSMLLGGHSVMRFTGSEIFSDAEACASEIAEHLHNIEYQTRP